jgi:hypothetical protein
VAITVLTRWLRTHIQKMHMTSCILFFKSPDQLRRHQLVESLLERVDLLPDSLLLNTKKSYVCMQYSCMHVCMHALICFLIAFCSTQEKNIFIKACVCMYVCMCVHASICSLVAFWSKQETQIFVKSCMYVCMQTYRKVLLCNKLHVLILILLRNRDVPAQTTKNRLKKARA